MRKFLISTDFDKAIEDGILGTKKKKTPTAKAKAAATVASSSTSVEPSNTDAATAEDIKRVAKMDDRSFTRDDAGRANLLLYIKVCP